MKFLSCLQLPFSLSLVFTLLAGAVHATDLQPAPGQAACFTRKYSTAHMQAHPGQALDAISIWIQHIPQSASEDQPAYRTARVVGERNGKLYGNEAWCEYRPDGSVNCSIDCDGGSFTLRPYAAHSMLFNVSNDYYFPLYAQGANPENTKPEDTLPLNYSDVENRTYKLRQIGTPACELEWQKYKEVPDLGC